MKSRVIEKIKVLWKEPVFKVGLFLIITISLGGAIFIFNYKRETSVVRMGLDSKQQITFTQKPDEQLNEDEQTLNDNLTDLPPRFDFTDIENLEDYLAETISLGYLGVGCCSIENSEDADAFLSTKFQGEEFTSFYHYSSTEGEKILFLIREVYSLTLEWITIRSNKSTIVFGVNQEDKIQLILYLKGPLRTISEELPTDGFLIVNEWPGSNRNGLWIEQGKTEKEMVIELDSNKVNLNTCKLIYSFVPDKEEDVGFTKELEPLKYQIVYGKDGKHIVSAECIHNDLTIEEISEIDYMDRQPEKCKDFVFEETEITITSTEDLQNSLLGTWEGCFSGYAGFSYVDTFIRFEFNADGTYSAEVLESLDGSMPYAIPDLQNYIIRGRYEVLSMNEDNEGTVELTIDLPDSNPQISKLEKIRLMDNKISFQRNLTNIYTPFIPYRLNKVSD